MCAPFRHIRHHHIIVLILVCISSPALCSEGDKRHKIWSVVWVANSSTIFFLLLRRTLAICMRTFAPHSTKHWNICIEWSGGVCRKIGLYNWVSMRRSSLFSQVNIIHFIDQNIMTKWQSGSHSSSSGCVEDPHSTASVIDDINWELMFILHRVYGIIIIIIYEITIFIWVRCRIFLFVYAKCPYHKTVVDIRRSNRVCVLFSWIDHVRALLLSVKVGQGLWNIFFFIFLGK